MKKIKLKLSLVNSLRKGGEKRGEEDEQIIY